MPPELAAIGALFFRVLASSTRMQKAISASRVTDEEMFSLALKEIDETLDGIYREMGPPPGYRGCDGRS